MNNWVADNIEHILVLAILIARITDIATTYIATPKFKLEANPLIRKYKLPLIMASLSLALVPYATIKGAIIVLVVSLLVSVSNSLRLWLVKAVGEDAYYQLLLRAALAANFRLSIFLNILPGLIMLLLAACVFLFYPSPDRDMGFYFALGMMVYGGMIVVNFPINFIRTRRLARLQAMSS